MDAPDDPGFMYQSENLSKSDRRSSPPPRSLSRAAWNENGENFKLLGRSPPLTLRRSLAPPRRCGLCAHDYQVGQTKVVAPILTQSDLGAIRILRHEDSKIIVAINKAKKAPSSRGTIPG